jgi:hypothetical protein
MTLSIMIFSVMKLIIKDLSVTLNTNSTQQSNTLYRVTYAECHVFFIVRLNAIMLSVFKMNVVAPSLATISTLV